MQLRVQEDTLPFHDDFFVDHGIGEIFAHTLHLLDGALNGPRNAPPRFFYLQYRLSADPISYAVPPEMDNKPPAKAPLIHPPDLRVTPDVSDPIDLLIARLKGKTLMVHSPAEFAKAVDSIRRASPN